MLVVLIIRSHGGLVEQQLKEGDIPPPISNWEITPTTNRRYFRCSPYTLATNSNDVKFVAFADRTFDRRCRFVNIATAAFQAHCP